VRERVREKNVEREEGDFCPFIDEICPDARDERENPPFLFFVFFFNPFLEAKKRKKN